MPSPFNNLKFSVFGHSHGESVGARLSGLPAGFEIDLKNLERFMARRASKSRFSTPRKETDSPFFESGVVNGITDGNPLVAVVKNQNINSSDYDDITLIPRPSHADYAAICKFGQTVDLRGGGKFSGRLTAPFCAVGNVALQILQSKGITINAYVSSIGKVDLTSYKKSLPTQEEIDNSKQNEFCACGGDLEAVRDALTLAASEGNSLGGTVEIIVENLPSGLGDDWTESLESRLASMFFAIPAVKGVEFGRGFDISKLTGSEANDEYILQNGRVQTSTNNNGGINGGISNGMPLTARIAVKPTPSIAKAQRSVDLKTMQPVQMSIKGRHDTCIALRFPPCAEAAAALVLLDALLDSQNKI